MGISLIVATVERTEALRRFLRSCQSQSVQDFEVILVDQNEDDRLNEIAAEFLGCEFRVRHIRQREKNLSGARNAGLRLASHEIVAFPDDDCWYEADVIEKALLAATSAGAVDGVVGRWVERARPDAGPRRVSWQLMRRFREVDASSIAIFLRRELVLALGGFDELLGVTRWFGSGEETDLVMRVVRAGKTVRYMPEIRVHHRWVPDPPGTIKEAWYGTRSRARGTGALYAKHRLSIGVVARGFAAPVVKCLLPPYRAHCIVAQIATVLGRCEGFVRWRLQRPAR